MKPRHTADAHSDEHTTRGGGWGVGGRWAGNRSASRPPRRRPSMMFCRGGTRFTRTLGGPPATRPSVFSRPPPTCRSTTTQRTKHERPSVETAAERQSEPSLVPGMSRPRSTWTAVALQSDLGRGTPRRSPPSATGRSVAIRGSGPARARRNLRLSRRSRLRHVADACDRRGEEPAAGRVDVRRAAVDHRAADTSPTRPSSEPVRRRGQPGGSVVFVP